MTYIVEKPTVNKDTGTERTIVTIEFYCKHKIKPPKFMLCERVIVTNHFPEKVYTVRGVEICISETPSGELLSPPRWKYKVIDTDKNSFWKEESALERYEQKTCLACDRFKNFHELNGRGWCNLFDGSAKTDRTKTNDCIINGASELNEPQAEHQIGSIVKIIDADENHTEWAVFKVVELKYNEELFQNTESYLNQPEWFYRLANTDKEDTFAPIWVAENEICDFNMAHHICISAPLKSFR